MIPCDRWAITTDAGGPDRRHTEAERTLAAGFGDSERAIFFSYMLVDVDFRQAYHLQAQVLSESGSRPAVSAGVLDMFDMRQKVMGIGHGARSFYVTATRRLSAPEHNLYLTLGLGTGRFGDGPFGGISWGFADHVTGAIEYDGLRANAAIAYGLRGRELLDSAWDGVAFLGYTGLERPVIGVAATYRR